MDITEKGRIITSSFLVSIKQEVLSVLSGIKSYSLHKFLQKRGAMAQYTFFQYILAHVLLR